MTPAEIAETLADWITAAGDATRALDDAAVEIATAPGGETRHRIVQGADGYTVSGKQRGGPYVFEFSSSHDESVTKFLVLMLGPSIRHSLRIEWLAIPAHLDDLPTGFSIDFSSSEYDALLRDGVEIARFARGSWIYRAVEFAQVADLPLERIKESFLDPDGGGLLRIPRKV